MRCFATLSELAACTGQEIGSSDWLVIDQARVDGFARAGGDDHWIHLDAERARAELPGGHTIVHGFLLLALVTHLSGRIWAVASLTGGLLYGLDKVRFPASLATGSAVRLRQSLESAEFTEKGLRVMFNNIIEAEGLERPVVIARTINVLMERAGYQPAAANQSGD
jgi:acyl dehydratase